MSVLKRVEELYLEVLRFIIIAAASVLLLAAIAFGGLAASNYGRPPPKEEAVSTNVNPNEVTERVLASKSTEKAATAPTRKEVGDDSSANDPNQALYERTANTIVNFVAKTGHGIESVDKKTVIEVIQGKAKRLKDPKTVKEFAEGMATTMEKTLSDPKILKLVELIPAPPAPAQPPGADSSEPPPVAAPTLRESPIQIVNETMSAYSQMFNNRLQERERAKEQALEDEAERRASMMTQLSIAGGTFGAFLILVFISIVVKIERNLRAMTVAAKPVSER